MSQGTLDSRTPAGDIISVSDFLKEVWDDYNSPTTSTFVLRIGQCRSTASNLEEVGGTPGVLIYNRIVSQIHGESFLTIQNVGVTVKYIEAKAQHNSYSGLFSKSNKVGNEIVNILDDVSIIINPWSELANRTLASSLAGTFVAIELSLPLTLKTSVLHCRVGRVSRVSRVSKVRVTAYCYH